MTVGAATPEEMALLSSVIRDWLEREGKENDLLRDAEEHPEDRRWIVRLRGEEKLVVVIWLTLRERTLHYETYFMPAPEENIEACFEYLLRTNAKLFGCRFAIGPEDAVYLMGQMPLSAIDTDELDRIIGSLYAYSEQHFRSAMSIGYATQFRR